MQTQEQLLQDKVDDFVFRTEGRYPSPETVRQWRDEISKSYWNMYDDEDYCH